MSAMTSQVTTLTIVYSNVYSGADQRKHQSPASLAFVRGIQRCQVNFPNKGSVTRIMSPFDDVIMRICFVFYHDRCAVCYGLLYCITTVPESMRVVSRLQETRSVFIFQVIFANPIEWEKHLNPKMHDDVMKWKHFPRYWPYVRGIHRSPVNSPHKGQWRGALMFSLIFAWINSWINNRAAGDLRRPLGHYDVSVMGCGWKTFTRCGLF